MINVAPILPQNSFRLIYLDPPFQSGRERIGSNPKWKYCDQWNGQLQTYLPWLEERLKIIYPLLVDNGSLVLHLDWRASHYAKVMLDEIFGYDNFMNEIVWHYTGGGRSKKRFSCKHDILLWYSKGDNPVFNLDAIRVPYKKTSGYAKAGIKSAKGKVYKPNPKGTPVDDVWDIPILNPLAHERVGYPTQKPIILLNRIIESLSNEDDLVADLCFGSGTTIIAAEQLKRKWVASDISESAVDCLISRLKTLDQNNFKLITDVMQHS